MHITLWIAQVILTFLFLMAGIIKSTQPIEQLHAMMPWTNALPDGIVRFIGLSEFLGALGLILPSLLRIKPMLSVLAAAGLTVIMISAAVFHLMRGEMMPILFNLTLGSLAFFIFWGRWKKAPILPK